MSRRRPVRSNQDTAVRFRSASAVALAITSGASDAISFLVLGGAFTSVMTGNLILLGISAGHADGNLARQIAVAVVGYIAGCAAGARIAGTAKPDDPAWPPAVARGLAVETCLFVVYAVGLWAVDGRPVGAMAAALLGLAAFALGTQSSTVRRFGVSGLSTTYLTGTLTTLVVSLARGHRFRDMLRHMIILVGLVCGATLAAILTQHAARFAALIPLAPLIVALSIASWHVHLRAGSRTPIAD
jgi:uncharacterized membrane protein YoaK (UPF0700 family)